MPFKDPESQKQARTWHPLAGETVEQHIEREFAPLRNPDWRCPNCTFGVSVDGEEDVRTKWCSDCAEERQMDIDDDKEWMCGEVESVSCLTKEWDWGPRGQHGHANGLFSLPDMRRLVCAPCGRDTDPIGNASISGMNVGGSTLNSALFARYLSIRHQGGQAADAYVGERPRESFCDTAGNRLGTPPRTILIGSYCKR